MFVPVSCHQCGKPFQVPETSVGKAVVCPWCQEAAPARTASPAGVPEPVPDAPVVRSRFRFVILGLLCVVVAGGTFAVSRYGSGQVPAGAWQKFTPPDGECSVLLPGTPDAEAIGLNPFSPLMRTGERYSVRRWFDDVSVTVGWVNLDAERTRLARPEDVIAAEQRRLEETLGGKVEAEATVKFNQHTGAELTFRTEAGPVIVRLIAALDRPNPRLFILSVAGSSITADGPVARKFFPSFAMTPASER